MAKSRAKPLATMSLVINEDTWTCSLWRAKSYNKKFGEDSEAITYPADKTVDFSDDNFDMETVRHELFHAHFKYLHLDSVVDANVDDIEEILASWIGSHLDKFQAKCNLVLSGLTIKGDLK